jgi:PAS domain S-box-containing protein
VHHAGTDFDGMKVAAEDFLGAILDSAAQPIWAVDSAGLIRFANRAAVDALGYDGADELIGRDSHETIHYEHPDGTPFPAHSCPMLLPRESGETVTSELDWFFRRDGSKFPVSYVSVPLTLPEGRGAVVAFTDIEDRLRAERALREHDTVLAAREASLRRIAALVAGGAASPDVFAAIAREVAQVLGIAMVVVWHYEPDRPASVAGAWSDRPHPFEAGSSWEADERTVAALLPELGRPKRIEDFGAIGGTIADALCGAGIGSGAGAAIVVDGQLWGTMGAGVAEGEPLDTGLEHRLAEFTELLATAISMAHARTNVQRLADEQAALRRVATLVARESPPADVFGAVTEEVGRLLQVEDMKLVRFEPDATATVLASWGQDDAPTAAGTNWSLAGDSVTAVVHRTGRPARVDDYANVAGPLAKYLRSVGVRSAVATPVMVGRQLWGALIASSRRPEPLPSGTESQIAEFTELVATAIANIQARTDLAASRTRIVAATDAERRRVVRDLHDGAQRWLVHTIITLKLAKRAEKHDEDRVPVLLTEALDHAQQAIDELRELAHGILPAVLTQGGLPAAVDSLASRMPLPVKTDVAVGRLPAPIEAAAYFVVAEALTNVAKHAHARSAEVTARIEDGTVAIRVRDDGVGGARPDGSGLIGLTDRLTALGGDLRVTSPARGGTLITAALPVCES